ncbi:MAG: sensor histidine kinase [Haloferacaceae archaeon]
MTDTDRARVAVVDAPGVAAALPTDAVAVVRSSVDAFARAAPDCVVLGDPTDGRLAALDRRPPGVAVVAVTDDPARRTAALDAGARAVLSPATAGESPDRVARRVVDAARAAAFERRRRLADATTDATALVGADGDIQAADEAFAAMGDASPASLGGRPVTSVLDPRHADLVLGAAEGLVAEPDTVAEFEHETSSGRRLSTRVAAATAEGELDAAAVAVRDVTDRELMTAELTARSERLEEVASLVSHDLRNPLNVVSGRLRLAEETGDISHVEPARRATERLCTLVDDIQSLARVGRRVRPDDREPVDLVTVAREAWASVETPAATLDTGPVAGMSVDADRDRLRTLFCRLFENVAAHAGHATVAVEPTPEGFAVVDDGPGFDRGTTDCLFDPGYTTDDDRTGFGLTVACAAANAHGWRVRAERSADGGARVVVDQTDGPP